MQRQDQASSMASHPSHERWNAKEVNNEPSIVSEEACDETDSIRKLFQKASEYLKPGPLFRWVVYLYSERKMLVFFLVHFVCTMTVWCKYKDLMFNSVRCILGSHQPTYSSLCADQVWGTKGFRAGGSAPLLVKAYCSVTRIRLNACHALSNGTAPPYHVEILNLGTLRNGSSPLCTI